MNGASITGNLITTSVSSNGVATYSIQTSVNAGLSITSTIQSGAKGDTGPQGPIGPTGATGADGPNTVAGLITAGTNVTITGAGTSVSPYSISSSGGAGSVASVNGKTGVVTLTQDDVGDGTTYKQYSQTEKTKLSGIATGATANQTDAYLLNRTNHTGTQAESTVTNLVTDLAGKEPTVAAGTTAQYYRGDKTFQTLNQDAVPDGTTNKAYTATDKTRLANTSGTNTGDQTITLTGDVTGSGTGSFVTAIGTGVIVNTDVNATAGIGLTKLAATTVSRALVSDASGFISPATTTSTEIGYVNGVTSAIQTQLNGKQATGNYITALTGDVTATGPGSVTSTIGTNVVTNAKAAQMAANTIKGNNTGVTANAADLSATAVTAMLNNFVGDSGSGGTKGHVPAPAAGDAAASKYLKADGTWSTVTSGTASPLTTKGDIYTYSTTNARLPVGSNGQILSADNTQATGLAWIPAPSGGGTTINYYSPVKAEEFTYSGSSAFTLTQTPGSIQHVTIQGQVLQSTEYSVAGAIVTVTPATHTFVTGDIVRIQYQATTAYSSTAGFTANIRTISASTTLLATDRTVLVDTTAGAVTITYPQTNGQEWKIKKITTDANAMIIQGSTGQTEFATNMTTTATTRPSYTIQSNGTNGYAL